MEGAIHRGPAGFPVAMGGIAFVLTLFDPDDFNRDGAVVDLGDGHLDGIQRLFPGLDL